MPSATDQFCAQGHPKEGNAKARPNRPGWKCRICETERLKNYFNPPAEPWCQSIPLHCAICGKHYAEWGVQYRGWYFCTFIRGLPQRIPVCSQPCRMQYRRLHDRKYRRRIELNERRERIQAYKASIPSRSK